MKGLVYTAILGQRDKPMRRKVVEGGVDYLMFTDSVAPKGWDEAVVPRGTNPRLTARKLKILIPEQADGYDWTLWVDGSHVPQVPIAKHVEKWLENHDFAAYRHHHWDCTYDEIRKCIELGKDSKGKLEKAREYLRDARFPEGYGQIASTVLARRMGSEIVRSHSLEWWNCIEQLSIRDQVSFMYCLWRLTGQSPAKESLHYIGVNAFKNELFHYQGGH